MKKKVGFILFILVLSVCCRTQKLMPDIELINTPGVDYRFILLSYEIFPGNNLLGTSINYEETFENIKGIREGAVIDGNRQGLWKTTKGIAPSKSYIHREEYFKQGLQDSTYTIYTPHGEILYRTTFNMGTGMEKDFHENEKLYYQIEKKDGYFTDTLKLYNENGKLMEKLFYQKDSLIYHEKIEDNGYRRILKKSH